MLENITWLLFGQFFGRILNARLVLGFILIACMLIFDLVREAIFNQLLVVIVARLDLLIAVRILAYF